MRVFKRKKELMSMISAAIFVLFVSIGLGAVEPPAEVKTAAEEGLCRMITEGVPAEIIDNADLGAAKLGIGFPIFSVNAARLQNDVKSPLNEMVFPTVEWYFVVKVEGNPIALMTVAFFEGKWTAVAIGDTGLSKEVVAFSRAWSQKGGYDFRFIRIFEAKSDFMEIRKGSDSIGFLAFESARVSFNLEPMKQGSEKLLSNSDIIEPLRDTVSSVISRDFDKKGILDEEE